MGGIYINKHYRYVSYKYKTKGVIKNKSINTQE